MSFSLTEAFLFGTAEMTRAAEAFPAGTLHIYVPVRNRKSPRLRVAPTTDAANPCGAKSSVFCNGTAGRVENCFRERKLQHDLAVVVSHLDGRAQQSPLDAV